MGGGDGERGIRSGGVGGGGGGGGLGWAAGMGGRGGCSMAVKRLSEVEMTATTGEFFLSSSSLKFAI